MNNANDPALGAMHAVWERMAGGMAGRGLMLGEGDFPISFVVYLGISRIDVQPHSGMSHYRSRVHVTVY